MERSEDYKVWKSILKRADVRDARLHDARHTAGTLLVEQGVNVRVVQEILGHARVTTTERYTHVASDLMRDASKRMGSALCGDGEPQRATAIMTLYRDQKGPHPEFG
ncbi:hypothetical protein GCM10022226_02450 [Sphaerisporangium flaviroseum]|uniref:Tyr recombinase domain-containing protein n=2 Tax=Sphaerisporangium flaviroseum TaxID=509199 RepID=A0ABP7HFB2_9ACTN